MILGASKVALPQSLNDFALVCVMAAVLSLERFFSNRVLDLLIGGLVGDTSSLKDGLGGS